MQLDEWIGSIRSRDAMTFEDAYWGERPMGPDVVPRLLAEMRQSSDAYTRGKFIELVGEMGDASVAPDLIAELDQSDPQVREWAVTALETLGTPEALAAASHHRQAHPDEFGQPAD